MSSTRIWSLLIPVICLGAAMGCSAQSVDVHLPRAQPLTAIFAGGCFWCTEAAFEEMDGVHSVESGYIGGDVADPSYDQVTRGDTGHYEAVRIRYDPRRIHYRTLLRHYWRQIDPTDAGGAFVDRGPQYRSAVFVTSDEQRRWASASKARLQARFDDPIATAIIDATTFYPAEDYHQDFYRTNPVRYQGYKMTSGRKQCLLRVWGDDLLPEEPNTYPVPDEDTIRARLDDLAYAVTRDNATEPAFSGPLYDHDAPGIYVDVISGEPLFSSTDKYASGSGWPSFTKPLVPAHVVEQVDRAHGMTRIEVRSRHADAHLGHLFDDGPAPTGLRYCVNSAALRFVPADELAAEGYQRFAPLFE